MSTDVDQARAAWYRELAALHGEDAVQFMDSAWPAEYAPGEPLEVMYAREAAHYALLALDLAEDACTCGVDASQPCRRHDKEIA